MRIPNPNLVTWKVGILFRGHILYILAIQVNMGFYGIVTERPS